MRVSRRLFAAQLTYLKSFYIHAILCAQISSLKWIALKRQRTQNSEGSIWWWARRRLQGRDDSIRICISESNRAFARRNTYIRSYRTSRGTTQRLKKWRKLWKPQADKTKGSGVLQCEDMVNPDCQWICNFFSIIDHDKSLFSTKHHPCYTSITKNAIVIE